MNWSFALKVRLSAPRNCREPRNTSVVICNSGSSFATSISLSLRNQFLLYSVLLTSGVFNWCWPIFRTNYTSIDKVLDDCVLRSYRLITLVNTYRSQKSDSERLVLALSDCDPSQDRADLNCCFLPSEMLIRLSVSFKRLKLGWKYW